ncbi:APC family permease [Cyanobium sp. Morenito 9A2]|nr:APC family permease [Cyanobium sp. Morenito 9A2]
MGGSIGAGILRTPGLVAAQLGNGPLILAAWALGGLYVLLGALAVAELGAAMPRAGGWTVYARRALGDQAGFAVGWIDWVGHCAGLAWVVVTIGAYTSALVPAIPLNGSAIALVVLLLFALIQLIGLEAGSLSQQLLSLVKALAFLALIGACLLLSPGHGPELAGAGGPCAPGGLSALVIAAVFALQAVITTYDGWQSPIYFAEEFSAPEKEVPRSLIGGLVVVIGLVLLVNLALLKVLPLAELAASDLPLADAARTLFGPLSGQVILVLALISSLGLVNTSIMCAPRILFSLSRDGLFPGAFALVRPSGTPVNALAATTLLTGLLVLFADFNRLLGVASLLYVLLYLAGMVSMLVLRWKEPELPRPFRAPGGAWAASIVALGSLAFLGAAALNDRTNSLLALALIVLSLPLKWLQRRRDVSSPGGA